MPNTTERLKKVQELFHAAVSLEPAARAAFLVEACESDRELLDEVQSLISAHEREGSFIDSPAAKPIAEMLASVSSKPFVGQTVGSFKILSHLGRGGMGEVYLAQDSKLGRKVALKLLPEEFTRREDLVRRFALEAKAASGLNHPNIVTVYEIGQTGSSQYIATEYIEGETLRQHFARGRMSLREVLDVVIQVGGALVAAHGAGIIHRDIKPENIMLRPDGYVKILDFGLAKAVSGALPGSRRPAADLEASTLVMMETEPGAMLGTIYYMAPEQARGLDVDARADIFSFGVITYEMLAGRRPFGGETNLDALISTLEKDPPPLANFAPDVPAELQRVVSKALRKNREDRYQTIKDMWIDLKNAREELAFEAKRERSSPPEMSPAEAATTSIQQSVVTESPRAMPASSLRKPRLARAVIGVLLVVLIGIVGVKMWLPSAPPRSDVPPPAAVERALNYWVTVQKYRDGKPYRDPFKLPGEILFEKDDQVRLHVGSPQDGHLYIFNEGPPINGEAPPLNVLFPSPTANNGLSMVSSGEAIDIPKQSWFRLDQEEGTEKLWLVWSVQAIPDFEATKQFANEKDRGVINSPGLDRSVKDFLSKTRSGSKPTVEKDDASKETRVKANGDIVVHVLALEHH
ncbi:MAG TPA: protein kinase [Blastocatellia bacterium]|nr:protein kinase [Blastocatellia bacterium]